MIKNKYHYQITGTLKSEHGNDVTDPIIKIDTVTDGATKTGLLTNEYNVYNSKEDYEAGYTPFKLWVNDARLKNFTYPVADVPDFSFANYKEKQRKILSDTFGIDINNVVLIEEV